MNANRILKLTARALTVGTVGAVAAWLPLASAAPSAAAAYPYRSAAFSSFVADSYKETPSRGTTPFYSWFEAAYARSPGAKLAGQEGLSLEGALAARRRELAALRDPARRAELERQTGAWLHRLVKKTIPKFSFDRGFEFTNTVKLGERQCLLQSVLIAGLLQSAGVEAGVVMVWKNDKAYVTNNGHAVTVVKLSSGRDLLVDASDPTPFMRHQGLFALDSRTGDYRFLAARFAPDSSILGYRPAMGGAELAPATVRPLGTAFLKSQFYYYRGERAPGGFMGPSTAAGLAASARFLEQAVAAEPRNPLAVYVLGHVYKKQGRLDEARAQYAKGYALYRRFGFVPDGPKAAYADAAR